jgi:hypothetical protein
MAKLCAHGAVIGTLEYLTTAKRYMSDGVILKNNGFGWKLAGKVKPGIDPAGAFQRAQERLAAKLAELPAAAAYRRELHALAGMGKRWRLHQAVTMMPDDPDGVWSEACDGYGENVPADIDDVVTLCTLFRAAAAARGAAALASADV